MKILLIEPAKPEKALGGEDFSIFEPLGLEYLAAGVAPHHDVRILDMRLDNSLDSLLCNFQPDVVGITSYTVHVNSAKRLFRQIKRLNPEIFTVVGGHHATVMPVDFCTPEIDAVVAGEGVFAFRQIIARLEKKMRLAQIPGAHQEGNGPFVIRQEEQRIDLDSFPFPRRDFTAQYRKRYFSEWMRPLASLRTSKGCYFRCKFCALWKLTGGHYLIRSPESIVKELGQIEEEYVFFADDESLLDTKRMATLAGLIRESGIRKRFFLYGRSDTISNHPDLILRWKEIGLERVFVGLEFFCDRDLQEIGKGTTAATNSNAVKVLKDLNIDIFPTFLVKPEFDKKDFADLRRFSRGLDLDLIGFSVLTPLPGTDLYDDVKEHLVTSNYDYFDFFHTFLPTRLPVKVFYAELRRLYKGSRSIRNQIKFIRKYPIREVPSLFRRYNRFMRRLKTLERDYEADSGG